MIRLLALLNGLLIALMILFNGSLARETNLNLSLVIINSFAFLTVLLIVLIRRISLKPIMKLPKYLFLAGFIGLLNITLNNVSFIHLGATLSMGLTLYGQLIASQVVDYAGLFGMKKQAFHPKKIIGFLIMTTGIIIMIVF